MDVRSDDDLLAATRSEPEAFAVFYRRHVGPLLAYFASRTRDAELAADLTAETFAAALAGAHRHRPERGPAAAWLYGIARRQLSYATRKGAVEDRARRPLGAIPTLWHFTAAALWPPLWQLATGEKPQGLVRVKAFLRGFSAGIMTPVDRERLLFAPEAESPQGVLK